MNYSNEIIRNYQKAEGKKLWKAFGYHTLEAITAISIFAFFFVWFLFVV